MSIAAISGSVVHALAGASPVAAIIVAAGVASVPLAISYSIIRTTNALTGLVAAVGRGSVLVQLKDNVSPDSVRLKLLECLAAQKLEIPDLCIQTEMRSGVRWTLLADLHVDTDTVLEGSSPFKPSDEFGNWFFRTLQRHRYFFFKLVLIQW